MEATPPGPQGMPVVGSAPRFFDDQLKFLTDCRQSYGDIASFALGSNTAYLITNPDDIEQVLVKNADIYRKPNFNKRLDDVIGRGLLLNDGGESWRKQRQRSQPAYRLRKFMQDQQIESARKSIEEFTEHWTDGDTIAVREEMTRSTVKIIGEALFGVTFTEGTVEMIRQQLEPLRNGFKPDIVRAVSPDWISSPSDQEFDEAHATLRSLADVLIRKRRQELPEKQATIDGEVQNEPTDVLSIMLHATRQNEIDEELLRQELLTVLLAGTDTTGLALAYTWYLLAHHPEVESRLHDELELVLGGDPPTAADLSNLNYTDRVVKETMRLYPPAHLTIREPTEPVELASYRIPRGAAVLLSQWVVHRDPRWYDDPETFDPDRWTNDRARQRPNYAYFPFGAGPRQCIGKPVAETEMKLITSTIAQNHRLEHTSTEPLVFDPAVTLQPADSIEMIVRDR